MQFFHTLLIASFCIFHTAFAMDEVNILAKINQTVVTNYDVENRIEFLQFTMPEIKKASSDERKYYAMQSLIQDKLRSEYIKKTNFKLNKEEKKHNRGEIIIDIKKKNIPNINSILAKNDDFLENEVMWRGVIDGVIRPKIQISPEIVSEILAKNRNISKEKAEKIAIDQQIQMQSAQIIEAMRKISIIEFTQEK